MAIALNALGAGLGKFAEYWIRQQQQNRQMREWAMREQAYKDQMEGAKNVFQALTSMSDPAAGIQAQTPAGLAGPPPSGIERQPLPDITPPRGGSRFVPLSGRPPVDPELASEASFYSDPKLAGAYRAMPGENQVASDVAAETMSPSGGLYPGSAPAARTQMGGALGGGLRAGGALTSLQPPVGSPENEWITDRIIQRESGGRNIPQQIVPPGGGYNPSVGRVTGPSSAQGIGQFITPTWREAAAEAGVDTNLYPTAMSAPPEIQRQVIAQRVANRGVGDWAPYNASLARDLGLGGGAVRGGGGGAPSASPEVRQLVQNTMQTIPPQAYGMSSIIAMAKQIDKINPGASPGAKMYALEMMEKLLHPSEQRVWDMFKMQNENMWKTVQFEQQQKRDVREEKRIELSERQTAATEKRAAAYEESVLSGGKKGSVNIRVTDAEGKTIYQGAAKETRQGWQDAKGNTIDIPDDATLSIIGRGDPGKQAAAQMIRLTTAANEARRQISNVARASLGTTTSWFQGLQAERGSGLTDGLRRTLANEITPRDQQFMSVLGRGLSRSLAGLETAGAATGLVNLTGTLEGLVPAKGDNVETSLVKIAEMRQIAEQGIESAMAAPAVGPEQKKLLQQVLADIQKAVPWTVADVLDLVQDPNEETYQSFAGKIGLGQPPKEAPAFDPSKPFTPVKP